MSPDTGSGQQGSSGAVLDPTMSLVGRLEDLSLGEILQIVSLSKRSGLLRLEAPDGMANLYVRAGKVIYSSRSDQKDSVLALLLESGVLREDQVGPLRQVLEEGASTNDFRSLLTETSGLTREAFQDFLRKRVEDLVYSFFLWEEGTFSFQLIEDETRHPLLSRVGPFFLDDGIGAQFLVMEGARLKDEMNRHRPAIPDKGADFPVEGGWEQEFEEQLTGEKTAPSIASEEKPSRPESKETDEFKIPDLLPPLPERISNAVVMIGLPGPLAAEVANGLNDKGITLQVHKDGADGITRIQELRQQRKYPFVLMDIEAAGITDDRVLGGLESVITMWDLGFHLPVGLVCRRELSDDLLRKLSVIPGLTVLNVEDPTSRDSVKSVIELIVQTVLGAQAAEAGSPGSSQTAEAEADMDEYYDIRQELSEDLEGIDLPVDTSWEGGRSPRQESQDPHMARLGSFVSELNRQDISGEITLLALRFASDFVSRAILFLVRKEDLKGLGQFGVELPGGQNPDSVVRSLSLPVVENSIFHQVTRSQQSYVGAPTGSVTENALFEALGGGTPRQIYLGPVVSMGKVAVLLYGDDYPGGTGLEPSHTLDIFLSHVGLALDRAFLEMKLKGR
ncbi:MAG: DUF4388 domain-containing protein [bacterium]|nr:DUF4388 domain-containing protein [bacterium]